MIFIRNRQDKPNNKYIFISGKSSDDKLVIGNIFIQYESRGIPLVFIIEEFSKNNLLIDWIDFLEDSLKANWYMKTTLSKIEEAVSDVYGVKYCEQVLMRLKIYILNKRKIDNVNR